MWSVRSLEVADGSLYEVLSLGARVAGYAVFGPGAAHVSTTMHRACTQLVLTPMYGCVVPRLKP